jgi:ribosome maturation protein SDO1
MIEVANKIILDGEIQLTGEYREKLRIVKKNKLVSLIQRTYVDPKTKLPHPVQRIENAFEEVKYKVDEIKTAENQLIEAVKALRQVLPLSTETTTLEIYIPSNYASKIYGMVKGYATPEKENWNNDGSLTLTVSISANLQGELVEKINADTHGSIDIKIR